VFSSSMRSKSYLHKGVLPLVITLQLLLGGGYISYDQLNLGKNKYTPLLGDLMVSKWGYEALAVEQFKDNPYEKLVYNTDKEVERASFYLFQVIPKLEEALNLCRNTTHEDSARYYTALLQHELLRIASYPDVFPFEYAGKVSEIWKDEFLLQETSDYLTYLGIFFYDHYENLVQKKSQLVENLKDSIGSQKLDELRNTYHNYALEEIVTNSKASFNYYITDSEIIPIRGAVYQDPVSNFGRTRLFCPFKLLNGQKTDTLWFNISFIWLLTAICYLLVLFNANNLIRYLFRLK
jgi:hypothetical protein